MSPTRSVRLPETLARKLQDAARVSGREPSEVIREALERHCDEILGQRLDRVLAGKLGVISSGVGQAYDASRSEEILADILEAKRREGHL